MRLTAPLRRAWLALLRLRTRALLKGNQQDIERLAHQRDVVIPSLMDRAMHERTQLISQLRACSGGAVLPEPVVKTHLSAFHTTRIQ